MEGGDKNILKVLFVCIGNSCRSPMAEAIMKNLLTKHPNLKWIIDSAAIADWNIGFPPESRCITVLEENGISINHIGRQVIKNDFYIFDIIFAMDYSNFDDLVEMAPKECISKIQLLGNYISPYNKIILDPYFEYGNHGFRRCYDQITKSCTTFLNKQIESLKKTNSYDLNVVVKK